MFKEPTPLEIVRRHISMAAPPFKTNHVQIFTDNLRKVETALEVAELGLHESLKRLLLEFDFLVEGGNIPDVRNDVIFVQARNAIAAWEKANERPSPPMQQ